jgi:hypothetical protein
MWAAHARQLGLDGRKAAADSTALVDPERILAAVRFAAEAPTTLEDETRVGRS